MLPDFDLDDLRQMTTEKMESMYRNLLRDVHSCIGKDFKVRTTNFIGDGKKVLPPCPRSQAIWSHHQWLLTAIGLGGCLDATKDGDSLSLALRRLRTIAGPANAPTVSPHGIRLICADHQDCTYCKRDISGELAALVKQYAENVPGLCLQCLKDSEDECWHAKPCLKHKHLMEEDAATSVGSA
jgi:hypothetical protein